MRNKISFLAVIAFALNVSYVYASECVDDDCELEQIEITQEIESADVLTPTQYEINWFVPSEQVCEPEQFCEYDYNCPFETPEECAIWYTKPVYKTTVVPRTPHLNPMRVDDMIFAMYSYDEISGNDPEMSPLIQRYTMLMNASDACCTSGIIYKMRQNGASDGDVYEFLKDDANRFATTKRCLVMSDDDIESSYSFGVDGHMIADVRNLCLCKNHQWFNSMLQPFDDIYERMPDFKNTALMYSFIDGMKREVNVDVNQDVQNAMELLKSCPK